MNHKVLKKLNGGNEDSVVHLVEIDGKQYVHKKAPIKHIKSEKFFHRTLERNGLSSLIMYPEYEIGESEAVFEYIPGSPPLGEVRSVENFNKMGTFVSAMHAITYSDFFNIDSEGKLTTSSWSIQFAKYIQDSFDDFVKVNNKTKNFTNEEVKKMERLVNSLAYFTVDSFSLVHGDLHTHNIMVRENGELVPFDKYEDFLIAPSIYDISLILSEEFNFSFFVKKDNDQYIEDRKCLMAFIETYGENIIKDQLDLIKRFALLRAMSRFPNKWKIYQVEMMKNILNSYS